MSAYSVPYLIPFLFSAMLSFGLAFYAVNFRRVPGAIPFILMTLIQSAWTSSMIMEIISPSLQEKQFWDSVQWALVFFVIVAVYWFTQSILPVKRVSKIPWWLLFVLPLLFMGLLVIDPTLVYPGGRIVKGIAFYLHDFTFSWLDWIAFVYVYAVLYYCIIVLWIERRQTVGQTRRKLTWALVGICVQSVLYQVLFLAGVSILGQRDTSPFTFLVGNLLMGWGLFRNRIFELGPIARSQVVENMADGFIVTDARGMVVDMNRAAQTFAMPNWNDHAIMDVFPDWAREIKSERLSMPLTQDFVRVIDGITHSLELRVSPLTDSQNDIVGYLVVMRNISQRKLLENALAASEARYRSIIDAMAEGVILHDQTGAILTCNQTAESILELTCEDLQGRNITDIVGDAVREDGSPFPEDSVPISTALRTGKPLRDVVIGIKNPAGTLKWLLINAQPFDFSDQEMSEIHQVIISFRDVTELRQMQAEAMRAEIAQDRARLLAQFIQSASHEFRTPLAIIGTSVYLMARQLDPAKRQLHAESAERQIKSVELLLETLVNMVQLDSGVPLERIPTQVDTLVRSMVVKFEKAAFDHQIRLQVTVSSSLPLARVDSRYLSMGIQQVLDNAIRYTPDGGSIDIDVTSEGEQMVVKVRDSGLGIAEDELDHIFDHFWRHDKAHSTPGFGLGLSIVQKVIEQHEGTIKVESKVGQGTTVTMRVPL